MINIRTAANGYHYQHHSSDSERRIATSETSGPQAPARMSAGLAGLLGVTHQHPAIWGKISAQRPANRSCRGLARVTALGLLRGRAAALTRARPVGLGHQCARLSG
jgi:hypothetical protein